MAEIFTDAAYLGVDRWLSHYQHLPAKPNPSYMDVRRHLENDLTESGVFVKDMAYALGEHYEAIPSDFTHCFLIRDPRRTLPSLKNAANSGQAPEWEDFSPIGAGFSAMWARYSHLQTQGQEALINESSDLLEHPDAVLQAICDHSGLTFSRKMVEWPVKKHVDAWESWGSVWYQTLLSATGFQAPSDKPLPETGNLPPDARTAISNEVTVYQRLEASKPIVSGC